MYYVILQSLAAAAREGAADVATSMKKNKLIVPLLKAELEKT